MYSERQKVEYIKQTSQSWYQWRHQDPKTWHRSETNQKWVFYVKDLVFKYLSLTMFLRCNICRNSKTKKQKFLNNTNQEKKFSKHFTCNRKISKSCIELQKWHSTYNRTWLLIWDPLRTHLPARISQIAACESYI